MDDKLRGRRTVLHSSPTPEMGMRVAVIGTGHVGLTTCVTLPELGHKVVGFDMDRHRVDVLRRGDAPFFEPGIQELLTKWTGRHRLRFASDPREALAGAEVIFICVGTPARADGVANLVAVEAAARDVARYATRPAVVVEKSTVPAGTAQRLKQTLRLERPRAELELVSNPEFLREGNAVEDSLKPERILIGAESPWAFQQMRVLYEPLIRSGSELIETDIQTAELSKHACNGFLAMKISYANALARICERAGADVTAVTRVMGADHRIGSSFLGAGMGYGGYCFPKDVQAFERLAAQLGYDFGLLREVARINADAVEATLDKVRDAVWNVEGKRIALLGLAFKPGTDDVRLAPALAVARRLLEEGATVVGYDPEARDQARAELPGLVDAEDPYAAATAAHCVVVCTEWPEFSELDLARLRGVMAHPVVVDGRNVFDPGEMSAHGFTYYPTGRPSIPQLSAIRGDQVVSTSDDNPARQAR